MNTSLRALIIDDEPLGRERIRTLLENQDEIEVVGECKDGLEAVKVIHEQVPDLVFLDIQMPELNGFGVIQEVGVEAMPPVVFVTAYDQYAVKAFEVHALDYLIKPFDVERFEEAVTRVVRRIRKDQKADWESRLTHLLDDIKPTPRWRDRLMIKGSKKMYFLETKDIDWIEAAGNYVRLHTGKKSHLIRQTMNGIEEQLNPDQFIRIHRSTIVNLDQIHEFSPMFNGEYEVLLKDGTRLTLSRGYRKQLDRFSS